MILKDEIINIILQDSDESYINLLSDVKEIDEIHIFDDLNFDSIKFIQLIVKLEDSFDFEFPDEYLQMDRFSTVNQIINTVVELMEEKSNG